MKCPWPLLALHIHILLPYSHAFSLCLCPHPLEHASCCCRSAQVFLQGACRISLLLATLTQLVMYFAQCYLHTGEAPNLEHLSITDLSSFMILFKQHVCGTVFLASRCVYPCVYHLFMNLRGSHDTSRVCLASFSLSFSWPLLGIRVSFALLPWSCGTTPSLFRSWSASCSTPLHHLAT